MSGFRLRLNRDTSDEREPEPGDVLISNATNNQWRVLAARQVKQRSVDPEWPRVFMLEVERIHDPDSAPGLDRVWLFDRHRR